MSTEHDTGPATGLGQLVDSRAYQAVRAAYANFAVAVETAQAACDAAITRAADARDDAWDMARNRLADDCDKAQGEYGLAITAALNEYASTTAEARAARDSAVDDALSWSAAR